MNTTSRFRRPSLMPWTVVLATGVLLLAGCGSDSNGSPDTQNSAGSGSGGEVVATGKTDVGTVLVDSSGRTLYAFAADTKGHSSCDDSCATYWPPVKASSGSLDHPDDVSATLGTAKRSDGTTQLTVDGWPMYTYAGDAKPGQATGQGKNLSGGLWWVVDPSGTWVKDKGGDTGGSDYGGGGY
jgi:predicted lipoprotein with Yx(FWY)xxD motif